MLKQQINQDPELTRYHYYFRLTILAMLRAALTLLPVPGRATVKVKPEAFYRAVGYAADFASIQGKNPVFPFVSSRATFWQASSACVFASSTRT